MIDKIYPPKLSKGDKIGVIATSTPITTLKEGQIKQGYHYLESKGFTVIEHPQCRKKKDYTAGTVKERVRAIHQFVKDKEIKCIMAFWGGLNTNQILDYLDYDLIKANPKIFIGYSDTCALLQALTTKTGLVTYMGPAVITFAKPDPFNYSWEYFSKMCIKDSKEVAIKDSKVFADDLYFLRKDNDHRIIQKNPGIKIFREGKAQGSIVACNLSTLLALWGTEYFPFLKEKILFIEEAEDLDYRWIHRFMTQLKQIGAFKLIKGLVIGKFMTASNISESQLLEILNEVIGKIEIPVIYDANFGHTDPIFTVPNGGKCKINTFFNKISFIQDRI
ncbi:MAG: S66 peptidase family protein [Patescibacteria group bacterium]|jgi:muramoyltetrapeptide carboxypeptidase